MENHQGRRVEHRQTPPPSQNRTRRKKRNPRRTAATVLKVLGTLCLIGVLSIGIFAWIFMQYVKTTLAPDLNIDLDDFTMNLSSVILYEDENVIVADKESGVNAAAVFSALAQEGQTFFIHRLDRNTAGLMIFAKTAAAEEELLAAFRERRVRKVYLALLVGTPSPAHAVLTAYLRKDAASSTVRVSDRPVGDMIVTEYEVLVPGETSLVKVKLHTGKTHQIRAHLAYIGHPVAGDEKYGDRAFNRARHVTRQRLVAKELTLAGEGVLSYLAGRTFVSKFFPKL